MNPIRNKKGQAMVEFALIIPIFLLLLLGMVDLSRVISANFVLDNAARSAARIGAVSDDDVKIQSAIDSSTATLDNGSISSSITRNGEELTIEIDYSVEILTPIVSNILGNSIPISGKTIMRIE